MLDEKEIKTIVHNVFEEFKKEQVNLVEDMINSQAQIQNQKMIECQAYVKKLRENEKQDKEERRALKYRIIFWSITSFITGIMVIVGYATKRLIDAS